MIRLETLNQRKTRNTVAHFLRRNPAWNLPDWPCPDIFHASSCPATWVSLEFYLGCICGDYIKAAAGIPARSFVFCSRFLCVLPPFLSSVWHSTDPTKIVGPMRFWRISETGATGRMLESCVCTAYLVDTRGPKGWLSRYLTVQVYTTKLPMPLRTLQKALDFKPLHQN